MFSIKNRAHLAHRCAWEFKHGRPAPDLFVCHHCDNKLCVDPDHLFLGTHSDNMRDMHAKGRGISGENHPWAKLSDEEVAAIRAARGTQRQIAEAFGISQGHVSRLKMGQQRAA